ncbi:MAG TPA: DUF5684 domain-containing protein [Mucilaginibacter sp.]|jgi:hypothetical protein
MENYDPNSAAFAAAIFSALIIPCIIVYIVMVAGMWKVFEKAGKPGWAAIIPIYNYIVMLEIVGKPIWWIFLILFPCTSLIFTIWTINLLSKSFGQSEGFTIGLILLSFIFFPILGFGSYQYLGPSAAEARGLNPNNPFNPNNYKDPFNNPPQA